MPTYISGANGLFTAAGTWKNVCSGAGANNDAYSAWQTVTASYVASPSFTIPNGQIVEGVILYLGLFADAVTGTLTVGLFDGAVALQEPTVTIEDLDPVDKTGGIVILFVKFASPVTGDGGSDYTLKLKASATNKVNAQRASGTNGDWRRLFRISTSPAGAPTTADVLYVIGEDLSTSTFTVTMNETATTAYGALTIGTQGILDYGGPNAGDPPAAGTNYVLRLAGNLTIDVNGILQIGTSANPVPRTSTAVLELSIGSNNQYFITSYGTFVAQGLSRTSGKNHTWALLTANMAVGATAATIDRDTGWLSGDEVVFAGTNNTAPATADAKTLNADAGADSLAWPAGTTYGHTGTGDVVGEVVLTTRNVKIRTVTTTYYTYVQFAGVRPLVDWDWVEISGIGRNGAAQNGASSTQTFHYCSHHRCGDNGYYASGGAATVTIDHESGYLLATVANKTIFGIAATCTGAFSFTDSVYAGGSTATSFGFLTYTLVASCTVERVRMSGCGHTFATWGASGSFASFEDNVAHSITTSGLYFQGTTSLNGGTIQNFTAWGSANYLFWAQGRMAGVLLDGLTLYGGNIAGVVFDTITVSRCRFTNLVTRGHALRATPIGIRFGVSAYHDLSFDTCSFGETTKHTTADLAHQYSGDSTYPTIFKDVVFRNCTFGSDVLVTNVPGQMTPGSAIGFQKSSATPIHWMQKRNGVIAHEPDVYNTDAPSEKLTPNAYSSANYRLPSTVMAVALDASQTLTIGVFVRKTAAYGGSAPRLVQAANPAVGQDDDLVLDTLSVGADEWEYLSGTCSAPTADGGLEFFVDCDGNAGSVYVDDWYAGV